MGHPNDQAGWRHSHLHLVTAVLAMSVFRAAAVAVLPVVLLQGCGGGTTTTTAPNSDGTPTVELLTIGGGLLLDQNPVITRITGPQAFKFTEGPVWSAEQKMWIFSDVPANIQYKIDVGVVSEYRNPSGKGNGNAIDPTNGNLITAEQAGRQVVSTNLTSGERTTLVDEYMGKKLNGPNDVIVSKAGIIYFTDPNYGSNAEYGHGMPQEQENCNVFRYDPSTKALTSVLETYVRPNGLAFNVAETKMYVADSGASYNGYNASLPHYVGVFEVDANGGLSAEKTFYTVPEGRGVSDGIKVDEDDNLWSTSEDAVEIFGPDGTMYAKINTATVAVNLGFGGEDGRDLLLAAGTEVWVIKTKKKGATDTSSSSIFQF